MTKTYATKKEAIQAANKLRESGKEVKVMQRASVYTQPGKGITSHIEYFLAVSSR